MLVSVTAGGGGGGGGGGGWRRDDGRGELAVGLLQVEGGAVAGGEKGDGGDGAHQGDAGGEGFAVVGGADDGGATIDGAVPSVERAGLLLQFLVVGGLVNNVSDLVCGDGLRRGDGGGDGELAVDVDESSGGDGLAAYRDVFRS